MLQNTASENIFVWMKNIKDGKIDSFEVEPESSRNALVCHNAGASLYFRSPQEMASTFIREMTMQLGINFGGMYPDGAEMVKT